MPAIDRCHQQVVRALEKAGWDVFPNPFTLAVGRGVLLFVDIRAQRLSEDRKEVLLVEVKCFPEDNSDTRQLYTALGQYLVYRSIVRQKALEAEVYLAVTGHAFDGVISQLGLPAIGENRVKMIVVDIRNEVIRQWL